MATIKSVIKTCLFGLALAMAPLGFAQTKLNHSFINKKMEATLGTNKEIIRDFYEHVLNNRKLDLIDSIVSADYENTQGEKGIEAFKKGIIAITKAFPDAKWTLTEVVAEGNKVFVKQVVEGTHEEQFQNIAPTNRKISSESAAIYHFKDGKIISHQIQTDRLGFLQQLGVLPVDISTFSGERSSNVFFVDKFFIPKDAEEEFTQRMQYNRDFIKTLPGFVKDDIMANHDADGNLILMTIAVWEDQEYLDRAKQAVQSEYRKVNFDPKDFMERLHINMERQQYTIYSK